VIEEFENEKMEVCPMRQCGVWFWNFKVWEWDN